MKYVEVKSRLMDLGFTSLEAERLYGLVMGPGPRYSSQLVEVLEEWKARLDARCEECRK